MSELHIHIHPDSAVLSFLHQLKEALTMDKAQLLAALSALSTQLGGVGDQLTAGAVQLDKATNEIILAISNAGASSPEIDAAVAALQAAGAALAGKATSIKDAAQVLDDLNQDAP